MDKRTRVVTRAAACAALTVAMMYVASLWPSGKAGMTAAASLFTAAAVIEAGYAPALAVYIVSAVLGLLILPSKEMLILYIAFFGYYPVIKIFLDRRRQKAVAWAVKLVCFNAALAVVWFGFSGVLIASPPQVHYAIICVAGSVLFAIYDYGFGKLIGFYIERISKNIDKG